MECVREPGSQRLVHDKHGLGRGVVTDRRPKSPYHPIQRRPGLRGGLGVLGDFAQGRHLGPAELARVRDVPPILVARGVDRATIVAG